MSKKRYLICSCQPLKTDDRVKFTKMENVDSCAAHQALFFEEKTYFKPRICLMKTHEYLASSISMVRKLFTKFRCGRTSRSDAKHSGRPIAVVTSKTIEKIQLIVLAERILKACKIMEATGTLHCSLVPISNDNLGMHICKMEAALLTFHYKHFMWHLRISACRCSTANWKSFYAVS